VADAEGEVEGLDEEFQYHLTRGSELLGQGELEGARHSLEKALDLRPHDPQLLALLGQAFYRQGQFEQAAVAWQRLVDDNPVEPGARVNLGLACLKARRYPDAIRQLEIALDLNPEHRKAMGYLGLALLESGHVARARDWFARAGSDQLVARCDEALAAQAHAVVEAPPQEPEPVQALSPLLTAGGAVPVVADDEHGAEVGAASPPPRARPARVPVAGTFTSVPSLAAYAASRLVRPPADEPFAVEGGTLSVAVQGELLCRLDGLVAWRGALTFTAEVKRFRGRVTEKPFGEGGDRVHRLAGQGVVVLRGGAGRFTILDLGGEAGFFREGVVFGFEEPVGFENGRLATAGGDLDLVHLRGRGRVVLRTGGEPVALDVAQAAPVRVPSAALVGWTGALTPRLAPLLEGQEGGTAVELTGEGRVLIDPGAAAAAGVGQGGGR
jgi:Flp pilus assembly protein TadD/uncharacterized protein (AIM24 family)